MSCDRSAADRSKSKVVARSPSVEASVTCSVTFFAEPPVTASVAMMSRGEKLPPGSTKTRNRPGRFLTMGALSGVTAIPSDMSGILTAWYRAICEMAMPRASAPGPSFACGPAPLPPPAPLPVPAGPGSFAMGTGSPASGWEGVALPPFPPFVCPAPASPALADAPPEPGAFEGAPAAPASWFAPGRTPPSQAPADVELSPQPIVVPASVTAMDSSASARAFWIRFDLPSMVTSSWGATT